MFQFLSKQHFCGALIVMIGFFAIMLGILQAHSASSDPSVIDGVMHAPEWSFADDSPLEIKGDWEVVWGKLLTPKSFSNEFSGGYFRLPSRWNDVSKPGKDGAFGVATFRTRLILPDYELPVAFHMIAAHSAFHLYIDGELFVSNGVVSKILGYSGFGYGCVRWLRVSLVSGK